MKNGFLAHYFILILCSTPFLCFSQDSVNHLSDILRNIDFREINASKKIAVIDSCYRISRDLKIDSLIALSHHMRGVVYSNNDETDFSKTVEPFIQAFRIRKKLTGISSIDVAKSGYWAGYHAYRIRELDTSEYYLESVIQLPFKNEFTVRSYKQLGIVESELGNYDKAIILIQQALDNAHYLDKEQHFNLYLNQSFILLGEKSRQSLLAIVSSFPGVLEKFSEVIRSGTIQYYNLARYYKHIALAYDLLEDHQKSIQYNRIGIELIDRNICCVEDLIDKAGLLNNIGNVYRKMNRLQDALAVYQKALDIYKEYNVVSGVAQIYDNLGEQFMRQKQFSKAISYYDSSYFLFMNEFPVEDHSPFRLASNKQKILTVLRDKADCLLHWYKHTENPEFLDRSLQHYVLADEMIDAIRFALPDESAQFHWREDAKEVYENSVPTALMADSLDLAFRFMERGKALVLSEALRKSHATQLIPGHFSSTIRMQQRKLDELEKQIFELRVSEQPGSEKIQQLTDSLLQLQAGFETLMDTINRQFPEYFESTHQSSTYPISRIQEFIHPDQLILSYFLTEDTVICARLMKDALEIRYLGSRDYLDSLISRQLRLINQFDSAYALPIKEFEGYKTDYGRVSYNLYQFLIEPWERLPDRIVIIPDENLTLINFETLLKSFPDTSDPFGEYDFLIKHYTFSQNPSIQLWLELTQRETQTQKAISLAPSFVNSPYESLDFEKESIDQLDNRYRLKTYSGREATRSTLDKLTDQSIIHFYTHAVIDEDDSEYSYILLSTANGSLDTIYLKDIYHLEIPNSLIVISACETHLGDVVKGEGVISLSRAFTYAGASSIVTSLWPVATEPSSTILNGFYSMLAEGHSKDEALRLSKLEYFEKASERKLEHPYIWGSFIVIGSANPIPASFLPPGFFYPAIIMGIVVLGWIMYRILLKNKMTPKSS